MVEGGGLENRCAERYRRFESYSLRHNPGITSGPCGRSYVWIIFIRNRAKVRGEMAESAEGARLLSECRV